MTQSLKKYSEIILHSFPSLIAIILVEVVNVQVYLHGPVSQSQWLLLGWLVLQMIPGFVFGYISDRYFRKFVLIVSQILGLIGGALLAIYGYENWVLILIGLTFNPMPVARAAFLDNFPQYSALKLVAITFLAQYLPWAFFTYLSKINYQTIIYCILGVLALNTILTMFWFKDDHDKNKVAHENMFTIKYKLPIILTLLAFTLSETGFYLVWAFLEITPSFQSWQSITSIGTLIGISLAMLYNRLPHISVITLFYSIGAGILLSVFFRCLIMPSTCDETFVSAMSNYSIVGGLYLPFVTIAVINMFGSKYKAVGSATIEFGDTIASFIAPITSFLVNDKVSSIVLILVCLYICAGIIQRYSEKMIKFKI